MDIFKQLDLLPPEIEEYIDEVLNALDQNENALKSEEISKRQKDIVFTVANKILSKYDLAHTISDVLDTELDYEIFFTEAAVKELAKKEEDWVRLHLVNLVNQLYRSRDASKDDIVRLMQSSGIVAISKQGLDAYKKMQDETATGGEGGVEIATLVVTCIALAVSIATWLLPKAKGRSAFGLVINNTDYDLTASNKFSEFYFNDGSGKIDFVMMGDPILKKREKINEITVISGGFYGDELDSSVGAAEGLFRFNLNVQNEDINFDLMYSCPRILNNKVGVLIHPKNSVTMQKAFNEFDLHKAQMEVTRAYKNTLYARIRENSKRGPMNYNLALLQDKAFN